MKTLKTGQSTAFVPTIKMKAKKHTHTQNVCMTLPQTSHNETLRQFCKKAPYGLVLLIKLMKKVPFSENILSL